MIAIFVGVFAAIRSSGAADASTGQENSSFLEQYKRKTGSFGSILRLTSRSCRRGFYATCFITRCYTRWCRIKRYRHTGGEFTPKNSTVASANFLITDGRDAGKKKICRVSCARSHLGHRGDWRPRRPFKRQRRRRYVLFDDVPKRRREQERDQLRAPVVQNQSLHICYATKSPRSVDGTFRV